MKLRKLLDICAVSKVIVEGDYNGVKRYWWQVDSSQETADFATFSMCSTASELPEEILNRSVKNIYAGNNGLLIHLKGEKKNA